MSSARRQQAFWVGVGAVAVPAAIYVVATSLLAVARRRAAAAAGKDKAGDEATPTPPNKSDTRRVLILYGTCTGTARRLAEGLQQTLQQALPASAVAITLQDAQAYDEFLLDQEDILLVVCSTWTDGAPPEAARRFLENLQDLANDFRVSRAQLAAVKVGTPPRQRSDDEVYSAASIPCLSLPPRPVQYAVFGLGTALYQEHFCKAAKDVHAGLDALGAAPLLAVATGDDAGEMLDKFRKWSDTVVKKVRTEIYSGGSGGVRNGGGARGGGVEGRHGARSGNGPPGPTEHKAEPSPLRPSPAVSASGAAAAPGVVGAKGPGDGGGDDTSSVGTMEVFNARRPGPGAVPGSGGKKANAFQQQQQRVRAEAAQASTSTCCGGGGGGDGAKAAATAGGGGGGGSCCGGAAGAGEKDGDEVGGVDGDDDELEDEDRINDQFICARLGPADPAGFVVNLPIAKFSHPSSPYPRTHTHTHGQ